MKRAPNYPSRGSGVAFSGPDKIWVGLEGATWLKLTKLFAPRPDEVRQMIGEVRSALKLPQPMLAALLGVPLVTLRAWERGSRRPSAAATRLLWLMHKMLLADQRKPVNALDLVSWMKATGSGEPPEDVIAFPIKKNRTAFWEAVRQAKAGVVTGHDNMARPAESGSESARAG